MKYKNFQEWFEAKRYHIPESYKKRMIEAWDAAVENDTTKADIIDKQKIVSAAMKIQCTCDQDQIKQGFKCGCGKQKAVHDAVVDLATYLKELK